MPEIFSDTITVRVSRKTKRQFTKLAKKRDVRKSDLHRAAFRLYLEKEAQNVR